MAVAWTAHRFSGGVLALDTTNTVVLRNDPTRRFDRFDDAEEIGRFAEAASVFRADEIGRPLALANVGAIAARVRALREAADVVFRAPAAGEPVEASALAELLTHCAAALEGKDELRATPERPFGTSGAPLAFEAALAVSALSLLSGSSLRRIKICRNCDWLFLDRSRNSSRLWCDMTVCGNRAKARQHYRRQKIQRENVHG
jgi:predicted RNA-binding Zn ribbon-like protein